MSNQELKFDDYSIWKNMLQDEINTGAFNVVKCFYVNIRVFWPSDKSYVKE